MAGRGMGIATKGGGAVTSGPRNKKLTSTQIRDRLILEAQNNVGITFSENENKDAFVDWPLHKRFTETGNKDEIYTRYYHFFEKNEIINLIKNINNLNIVDIYFEHENWIIILEKI